MNWISICLAALSGGLAAAIAALAIRNPKERRVAYAIVFFVSLAVLQVISRQYVFPDLNARYQIRKVEADLLEIPAFQTIKQYDPKTYEKLKSGLRESIKKGTDDQHVIGLVREQIIGLLQKRLPYASDEAVVTYMNVMLTEMNELNRQGPDLCYQFLFPQQSAFDGRKYFSKQTQEADLAALAQIFKTAAENPQTIPGEAEVMPALKPIYVELAKEHGNDIIMLQNPGAPNVDKVKICSMVGGLYTRVVQLPQNESGKVLRFMLSQN
jgi:hypothetical protein